MTRLVSAVAITIAASLFGVRASMGDGASSKAAAKVSEPEVELAASVAKKVDRDEASPKAAEKVSEPEVEFAAAVAKKVDRDEATWQDLTAKLAKAVESY